ncbi:MAG: glycoside hydrolase family 99-like domain-containing protein [Gemmatimonadaceae bacterium]|nr:glycoside hydrolase family 99-like domain-containing protein [Gemmatimonadaceae bacterium]
MHGVSVFSGWANPRPEYGAVAGVQCSFERPWETLQTNDRNLALGRYDEADPKITEQRLEWMASGGIDFACYQIEWSHMHAIPSLAPAWLKPLPSPLLNSHCADAHGPTSPVKYCVSWWDVTAVNGDPNYWNMLTNAGWTAARVEDSISQFASTVATKYMKQSNYLHVDGRPVLFRGHAHTLQFYADRFGITPQRLVTVIKEGVRAAVGQTPYLIATSTEPAVRPLLKAWGFDAFTDYLLHGSNWTLAMDVYRWYWGQSLQVCEQTGIEYWVAATAGYDARAWPGSDPNVFIPTPAQFTAHLKEARGLAMNNYGRTRGMVITYAWNEIGEGGIMEPMLPGQLHDGDTMLRAHRAATYMEGR